MGVVNGELVGSIGAVGAGVCCLEFLSIRSRSIWTLVKIVCAAFSEKTAGGGTDRGISEFCEKISPAFVLLSRLRSVSVFSVSRSAVVGLLGDCSVWVVPLT